MIDIRGLLVRSLKQQNPTNADTMAFGADSGLSLDRIHDAKNPELYPMTLLSQEDQVT